MDPRVLTSSCPRHLVTPLPPLLPPPLPPSLLQPSLPHLPLHVLFYANVFNPCAWQIPSSSALLSAARVSCKLAMVSHAGCEYLGRHVDVWWQGHGHQSVGADGRLRV
mmetsp:Transcript_4019/g.8732  ORF Transcript_4019/g.8732 Transcript_4019/m.8732 type:complete len:108 (+) Transcript_4019:200-523(+)